jgi:hypothetical protein
MYYKGEFASAILFNVGNFPPPAEEEALLYQLRAESGSLFALV